MLMLTVMLMRLVAMMTELVMSMAVAMPWRSMMVNMSKLTMMAAVVIIMTMTVPWRTWPDKIIVATPATAAFGLGPCVARFNAATRERFVLKQPLFVSVPTQH